MAKKTLLRDKPDNLLRKYHKALKAKGIFVDRLILFGSYAKGNPMSDSDIDVAVVSTKLGKHPFREMVNLSKIAKDIEPLIEPHPFNPKDLKDKWDPLACQISQFGVKIRI